MSDANRADLARVETSVPPPGYAVTTLNQQSPLPRSSRDRSKLFAGGLALAVLVGFAFLLFGSASTQLSGPIAQAATISSSSPGPPHASRRAS
jgi:hypothetical protein